MQSNTSVINQHFDNIYVLYINAVELDRIKHKMKMMNIKVQYFKGVNGRIELRSKFDEYVQDKKENNIRQHIPFIGSFGHIHSIINIIKDAIKKKYKKILILEPDIYFIYFFEDKVKKYLKLDYKLLYLGASQQRWGDVDDYCPDKTSLGYYHPYTTYGTFALGLDSSIFDKYLIELEMMNRQSDVCLVPIQNEYRDQCYVTYPNLISCDVTKSNTSLITKNQSMINDRFRWDNNYIIKDRFLYSVTPNILVKIIFNIHLIINNENYSISVSDYNGKFILPQIFLKHYSVVLRKYFMKDGKKVKNDTYIIHILSSTDKIYIHTRDLFIENVRFDTSHINELRKIAGSIKGDQKSTINYYNGLIKKISN